MKQSRNLAVLAMVLIATLAGAGLVALAQNQNTNANANANASKKTTGKKHIRATRKPATGQAASTGTATTAAKKQGRCDPTKQEQTDLSGTYKGKINLAIEGAANLTGDATLTITGNNFTLTSGSSSFSGRITAETTCGYTGATMWFSGIPPGPGLPPMGAVSIRAKKAGDGLTLMTVPGEKRMFSFGAATRPRRHKAKPKAAAAPAAPAATPATTAKPKPAKEKPKNKPAPANKNTNKKP